MWSIDCVICTKWMSLMKYFKIQAFCLLGFAVKVAGKQFPDWFRIIRLHHLLLGFIVPKHILLAHWRLTFLRVVILFGHISLPMCGKEAKRRLDWGENGRGKRAVSIITLSWGSQRSLVGFYLCLPLCKKSILGQTLTYSAHLKRQGFHTGWKSQEKIGERRENALNHTVNEWG